MSRDSIKSVSIPSEFLLISSVVWFDLNGETRSIQVEDKKAAVETVSRPKANPADPGDHGASMSGVLVELRVKEGQEVKKGDPCAVIR